jgi:hypothetical protein
MRLAAVAVEILVGASAVLPVVAEGFVFAAPGFVGAGTAACVVARLKKW